MAHFVHAGHTVEYTPSSDLSQGSVVVQGELVGVAQGPLLAGHPGALAVAGVFDFPKAVGAATAIAVGASVYWDAAQGVAKTDSQSGANQLVGKTVRAAADADATVRVRLNQ